MKTFLLLIFMSSFNIFAHDYCYTHGDCQKGNVTQSANQCYLASTGTDNYGNRTCAIRCINVEIGHRCHFIDDNVYGICLTEKLKPIPAFDPSDPNRCKDAIELFP